MTRVPDLEQEIRDLINAPRKHLAIRQDPAEFLKLCSCLDVIGDTELAFDAYSEMSDDSPPGSSYILAYGFLQALVVQQDAVRNLYEALRLRLPSEPDPQLKAIREVRNDAIGHPTKRGGGKGRSFSYISRPSISQSGFQLMTWQPKETPTIKPVSFESLRDTQRGRVERLLDAVVQALRQEATEHRQRFRAEKLVELVPAPPFFESICEAVHSSRWRDGARHISTIRGAVDQFKAALERRQIAGAYDAVDGQIERLEELLAGLAVYFSEKGQSQASADDAEIVASFLQKESSKLREMAGELDADYAVDL